MSSGYRQDYRKVTKFRVKYVDRQLFLNLKISSKLLLSCPRSKLVFTLTKYFSLILSLICKIKISAHVSVYCPYNKLTCICTTITIKLNVQSSRYYNCTCRVHVYFITCCCFSYSLNKHLTDHLIGKIALLDKQTKSLFTDSIDLDQVSIIYTLISYN